MRALIRWWNRLPWRRPNFPTSTDGLEPPTRVFPEAYRDAELIELFGEIPEDDASVQCLCAHWDPEHAWGRGRCSHPGCGCLILRPREDAVARD